MGFEPSSNRNFFSFLELVLRECLDRVRLTRTININPEIRSRSNTCVFGSDYYIRKVIDFYEDTKLRKTVRSFSNRSFFIYYMILYDNYKEVLDIISSSSKLI